MKKIEKVLKIKLRKNEVPAGFGARAGCGRKATGRQKIYATTAIAGTPEEIEKLKKAAAAAGKSVSRFVLDMI